MPSESRLSKESISPETVGKILQDITDLLATAIGETEYNIIRVWKETLQQYRFLYDIQQRAVDDHNNVILQLMARSLNDGAASTLTLAIGPATHSRAGVLTAEDYAQRTNTIGSLKGADVCINWAAARHSASELASALALHQFSKSITAPMALAQSQPQVIVQESKDLRETIARLNERLDEPFVTAGTVTGDKGIKQAQDEYQRLMNNKSPESKRK